MGDTTGRRSVTLAVQRSRFVSAIPAQPLSAQVRQLCAQLSNTEPIFLPFTKLGRYRPAQCHANVFHRVRAYGGERVNGWMIGENPYYAEAEFHCVWRSSQGQLLDITPRRSGAAMILFLPDPATRLMRGPFGTFIQPANRTTAAYMPYTCVGQPYPRDIIEVKPNDRTLQYCKSLGFDLFDLCE
jgi:hypothetical protein